MNRPRETSKALLGAAAGVLTAAFAYRAYTQGLLHRRDPSLDVWRDFDSRKNPHIVRLISASVLAASPHNSQPWRFSVRENQVLVHADFDRKLGAMDPFEREMFIGLGCALENMAIAAPGAG